MEVIVEYNSSKAKLYISNINSLKDLINEIKKILNISSKTEIELYTQPKNSYLMESNFEEEFLKVKKDIKGILVQEIVDLTEKIKNIGIPINQIEEDEDEQNQGAKSIIFKKANSQKIFSDKCVLCKNEFNSCKFGCLLCPNYFLCKNCEEKHPHPMIKYKSRGLSDKIYKILDLSYSQNMKEKDFNDYIKRKYKYNEIYGLSLRTNISSNSFIMGTNQTREINLLIKNNNRFNIPKNTLNIFIKNQYDLKISINEDSLNKDLNAKMEIPIKLVIKSNEKSLLESYNLRIEVISNNIDIISTPLILKINIKDDEEENTLNKQFNEFPSIVLLPKDKKKQLQYIIKEKLSVKTPAEIKAIMEKFKWNIDEAISDLVV